MTEKEYFAALSEIRGSRKNEIICAVNRKLPPEQIPLKSQVEERFYQNLWTDAEAIARKYGFWPVYEMCEIETDDTILDIYTSPAERT